MSEVTQEDDKTEKKSKEEEISFDAVDLMLEGIFKLKLIILWLRESPQHWMKKLKF